MTNVKSGTAGRPDNSILVVSGNQEFAASVASAYPDKAAGRITVETASFSALNGRAVKLIANHDVVIFDARPDDRAEIDALSQLLSSRRGETLFLALADERLSIAEARKLREAGIGDVLPNTIGGADLRRTIDKLLAAREAPDKNAGGNGEGTVVGIVQARGGVGSTTVSVNLARSLIGSAGLFRRSAARRVALVDLDLQFGNANAFLDIEDRGGFLELLEADHVPSAAELQDLMQRHASGLHVLCAPAQVVPLTAMSAETVSRLLDALQAQHDFVVIDLPRVLVEWVAPVLNRVAKIAIVTDLSVPSIRQAKRLIDFYRETNAGLKVEMVVNRERRPLVKSAHIKEAERVLNEPLLHWLPDAPREARRAADLGQPVVELYRYSALARGFGKLAAATAASAVDQKKPSA
jgi:pilus assembly protein CpaE